MLATIPGDARYALRGMAAKPAFTAVVLATLTLGIGANTAMFSVIDGILLRPLPYADPQRLMQLEHGDPYYKVSEPEFLDYRRAHSVERIAAVTMESANVIDGAGDPERITGARVSDGFFQILGMMPAFGRTFTAGEDEPNGPPVIVLSYGLWQRRYGADVGVVGKHVVVNGVRQTVVGVMPPRFAYPSPDVAAWIPLRVNSHAPWARNNHYLTLVAKLAPGVSFGDAVHELGAITRRWAREYPDTYAPGQPLVVNALRLDDAVLGKTRPYLYALSAAVAFTQLIVCANVASLLLARGESRRRELAIRAALGGSRARLVRQAFTESAMYAGAGGALGLIVAWAGMRLLIVAAPSSIPRLDEVGLNGSVLLFGVVLSIVTALLFGLGPALRSADDDVGQTLTETGGTVRPAMTRIRRVLVISEVALSVIVLSAAGLMMRSLWKLQSTDLGFLTHNVLTVRVGLPPRDYQGDKSVILYQTLLNRVRALGGVRAAAAVADLPVADGWSVWSILVDGAPMTTVGAAPSAMREQVTPGYFEALGIRVVRGRAFTEGDRVGAPLVAMVNETMERKRWPGKSAVGGTIKVLSPTAPWVTVVGVVADVRQGGFLTDPPPTMFFPHEQAGVSAYYTPADMTLVIRTAGDPLAVVGAVRAVVRQLEPSASLARVQSMDQVVATSVASRRFTTQVLAGFGALALVLAGIGIYGVISYGVTQRTFELALRIALGAPRWRVLGLVLTEGIRLTAIGVAVGLLGAVILTQLMRTMFVGLTPRDPMTLAAVTIVIAFAVVLASWLPGRRAMAVAPMHAMRAE
jgi:putative ABC transport system permease protein